MEHRAVGEHRVASCCPTIALCFRRGGGNEEKDKMVARECSWLSQRDTEKNIRRRWDLQSQQEKPQKCRAKAVAMAQTEPCRIVWHWREAMADRALPPVSCTGEHNESDRWKENAGKERMKTRHQMHGKLGTMTDLELTNMRHAMTKGCSHPFVWVLLLAVWLFCLCDHCSPICFSIFFTTAFTFLLYLPGFLHSFFLILFYVCLSWKHVSRIPPIKCFKI